ncbi:MAG: hypothetical protein K9N23_11850 [Akkermansiaceae bacterium]|nr:hypothetical protein [Akkermansiaceae bacterium]
MSVATGSHGLPIRGPRLDALKQHSFTLHAQFETRLVGGSRFAVVGGNDLHPGVLEFESGSKFKRNIGQHQLPGVTIFPNIGVAQQVKGAGTPVRRLGAVDQLRKPRGPTRATTSVSPACPAIPETRLLMGMMAGW